MSLFTKIKKLLDNGYNKSILIISAHAPRDRPESPAKLIKSIKAKVLQLIQGRRAVARYWGSV